MSNAPTVRGLFLTALRRPVLVRPSDADPAIVLDKTTPVPADVTLPVVVRMGEETYEVSAPARGEREISGRVALVTGGAQGFGAEIAKGLVEQGCFVYIADLNGDGAAAKCAELGRDRTHPITVNVGDEDSVAAMTAEVERTTGGLDLVISNAGIVRAGSVLEQDLAAFKLSTDINYVAFFLVTKHLGGLLARQRETAPGWLTDIIQINSKSGLVGSNKNGAYAGSKFGGIGLVQSFALELVEHGIKVNAVCPGNFYDGPLWSDPDKGLFVQYLNSGKVPGAKTVEDVKAFYEAKVPMRRGTTGIDVLRAIYYIVEQAYETGQAVPVTGGQVMLNA
ncbi:SDR family NAD(P)-dependent oxidoreductase [Arachnia rubra]|jgi:sorbitol-6-phosphate 2-dehydrogenase|uniref:SDR family NAD(P)-dependent oxidoreductase n=1 Tax=Arachnia rubra TaxID=1547448 RepID=A0ABX7Y426_9ACTN|nr:SDR family NAD(P)-dependent oxidoreductase [Arachnia rubra]QUC07586.1 SDR family NAD(P)-dependent oxidoreductase [Arachnia rubra]BCR81887.1 sorbitol 6-phosphate dehydrogenase [Arachnia rubra]